MHYVDGFVIPIPKKNLPSYLRMARKAAKIMKDPRMANMGDPMPFDMKRVAYGGFKVKVDA